MTPEEFIKIVKEHKPQLPPQEILSKVDYVHNGKEDWDTSDDKNVYFREEVVDLVFESNEQHNLELIKHLLRAEIDYCREETLMTDVLRKLVLALYLIGNIEDVVLLIEAKIYTSFDASCSLFVELMFGRQGKEEVKKYFQENPHPIYDVVACIEEYEKYEHRSPKQFIKDMIE
ncbi:MAG: hypothetical protein GY827_12050 [Cytophagales bacterium]|nr:hypothetical protein [Cytophagales bacterium]